MIKFLDIKRQDKKLHKNILNGIAGIINKGNFINGKEVSNFENEFAKFCGSKNCIAVGNGTDALHIALKSLNLKKNSEIIIPAMTYKSTLLAITNLAHLKPVLVDVEINGSNFDLEQLKKKITTKTKVILAVHLYGNPINNKEIKKIIKGKNIYLVEDSAQAHGAYDKEGKMAGNLGILSCFSFYPGKNLGAYGDAGCITTNSKTLTKKIKAIRNLGSIEKFDCELSGVNSRMDTIQAVILSHKIKELNTNNNKRKLVANKYNKLIQNKNIFKLNYSPGCVYHQYIIISKFRKKIIKKFKQNKIDFGFHYPISINNLKFVKAKYKKFSFPNAEKLARFGISLPIDPNLEEREINKISKILNEI